MNEKTIYILLTDTGTIFTRLIKVYTKKPYNHASISFDANLEEVYSFGRKVIWNPFNGGFVKENVKTELFKHATCVIYSLKVTEEQLEKMKDCIQTFITHKDSFRYNFLGLFGFIMKKPIHRERALFCSQFVATVLESANIVQFDTPTSLIAPDDLRTLPGLKLEFEGKLHDYQQGNNHNCAYVPIAIQHV
mgnify:CR=1 FL=1